MTASAPEILSGTIVDNPPLYAIIGTREPDENQIAAAKHLAFMLATLGGARIQTGAANGIDEIAMGATPSNRLTVFLPWASYNRNIVPVGCTRVVYSPSAHPSWTESVKQHHPAFGRLSQGAIALHARNYGIVHGCKGVIAFPNESGGGGTGQGIRIARSLKIPVIIGNKGSITDLPRFLGKAFQELGLASKDLKTTIPGRTI